MILCIDLGATTIKAGLIENNLVIKTTKVTTEKSKGRQSIVESLDKAITSLLNEQVTSIGISSAGTIDTETGEVIFATDNLPNFTGFNFYQHIKQKYNIPCAVINDGHAAFLGEVHFGGHDNINQGGIIMLTLGSGVGGGYIRNGKIIAKKANDYARLGHIILYEDGLKCTCGKTGCIEQYLSGWAINKLSAEYGIEKDSLFTEIQKGNEKADLVFNTYCKYFKDALMQISKKFDFKSCIVGGGVVDGMGESFAKLKESVLPYKIIKATLGNNAGMFGAYQLVKRSRKN